MLRNNGVRPKNWASAGIAPTPRYRTRPGAKPAPRSTGKPESHFQCLLRDSETIFRNPQPNDTPDLLPARPLARENANTAEGYGEAPSWLTTIPTRTTPTSPSNNWTPTAWRPGRTHSSPGCFRNSSISSHRHGRRCHPHHRLHSSLHAGATNLLRDNIPTGAGQDRGSSPVRHGDVHRGLPHIRSWSDNEPAGRNQNGTGTSRGMTPWPPGPPRCGMNYARPQIPTDSFELPTRKAPDVTVQTSGVELAEGLLMTAGLSVNSRYEPKNSRRSDTQIPSSLNSYHRTPKGQEPPGPKSPAKTQGQQTSQEGAAKGPTGEALP